MSILILVGIALAALCFLQNPQSFADSLRNMTNEELEESAEQAEMWLEDPAPFVDELQRRRTQSLT